MIPHWLEIVREVAAEYGVTAADILSTDRVRDRRVEARQAAVYRMRHEIVIDGRPASYPRIARWLGRSDHTTMVHAYQAHVARMDGRMRQCGAWSVHTRRPCRMMAGVDGACWRHRRAIFCEAAE